MCTRLVKARAVVWATLLSSLPACTGSSGPIEPRPAAAVSSARAGPAVIPSGDQAAEMPWVEALRSERWAVAARLIDELPATTRAVPGVRYARARAALALGDPERALAALENLSAELPQFAGEIARYRAAAQLEVGPFAEAAAYFARGNSAASLTKAALAYERAPDLQRARLCIERALVLLRKSSTRQKAQKDARTIEAEARALRARIAEKQGNKALALVDLRWLALSVPTGPNARGVDEQIQKLSPEARLTRKERYERATLMAREGLVEATERELELMQSALGPPVKQVEILRVRGFARFSARKDYRLASELLTQAAELGSEHAAKDLFYAARSLSRDHDDARAIDLYEALARRFPASSWAEDARFLSARLRHVLGRWDDAAEGYRDYLVKYKGRGRYTQSAKYELAVARLAGEKFALASRAFAELAGREDDPRERVRYLELEGVALLGAGDRAGAADRFRSTIREYPLSFAALASRARLKSIGEVGPPVIEPPATSAALLPPLNAKLPGAASALLALGLDADAERELSLSEDAIRRAYGARGDEALCELFSRMNSASARYRIGQRAARASDLVRAPSAASRWIWDCIYPRPYAGVVRDAASPRRVSHDFVYAIMRQESGFRPNVVSPASAIGLMQLIPTTAELLADELGVEYEPALLSVPSYNIELASHYLSKLLAMFDGNLALAAAAYNAGPQAVSRWLETGESLPLDVFVARIPYEETRGYVHRVIGNVARYAYLEAGEPTVPELELELKRGLRAPPDAY